MARQGAARHRHFRTRIPIRHSARRRARSRTRRMLGSVLAAITAICMLIGLPNIAATATTNVPMAVPLPEAPSSRWSENPEDSPSGLKEGVDYSFQAWVRGKPVHWPCSNPIRVAIEGSAPPGAGGALDRVLARVREASELPLTVVRASQLPSVPEGVILIRYVQENQAAYGMSVSGDVLGQGESRHDADGVIVAGRVIVRNDMNPTTSVGEAVLMHELGHALGLGHSEEGLPEVMDPTSGPDTKPILGPGDQRALRVVGC